MRVRLSVLRTSEQYPRCSQLSSSSGKAARPRRRRQEFKAPHARLIGRFALATLGTGCPSFGGPLTAGQAPVESKARCFAKGLQSCLPWQGRFKHTECMQEQQVRSLRAALQSSATRGIGSARSSPGAASNPSIERTFQRPLRSRHSRHELSVLRRPAHRSSGARISSKSGRFARVRHLACLRGLGSSTLSACKSNALVRSG